MTVVLGKILKPTPQCQGPGAHSKSISLMYVLLKCPLCALVLTLVSFVFNINHLNTKDHKGPHKGTQRKRQQLGGMFHYKNLKDGCQSRMFLLGSNTVFV